MNPWGKRCWMDFWRRDESQVQVEVVGSTGSVVASSREEALAGDGRNISSFGCAWPIKCWMLLQIMGGARCYVLWFCMASATIRLMAAFVVFFCSFRSSLNLAKCMFSPREMGGFPCRRAPAWKGSHPVVVFSRPVTSLYCFGGVL